MFLWNCHKTDQPQQAERVKESEGLAYRSPFSTTTDTGPPAFVFVGRNWSALEKADSWAPPPDLLNWGTTGLPPNWYQH